MPPPRPALSLPRADEVSGSAARAVAMTRSRTLETSPQLLCWRNCRSGVSASMRFR